MSEWLDRDGNPVPDDDPYLSRLRELGVLDEVQRIWDAKDAGEDLGPVYTADEVIERLRAMRRVSPSPLPPPIVAKSWPPPHWSTWVPSCQPYVPVEIPEDTWVTHSPWHRLLRRNRP